VYVGAKHLEYAKAHFSKNRIFLTADVTLSFGMYNPGVPPEERENTEKNDYLQFYLSIKNGNGNSLVDAIKLHGGPLWALANLKLAAHWPQRKPKHLNQGVSSPSYSTYEN
jgi:hypothetical protein